MKHKDPQVDKETAAKLEVIILPFPGFPLSTPLGLS
jgi:hypothetical protein